MLEKVSAQVDEKTLGVGVQISVAAGEGRGLGFTAGFPLDWEPDKINELLDKLMKAAERQADKVELKQREASLRNDYAQLEAQLSQKAAHEANITVEWTKRGKQGDFKLTEAQIAQQNNYQVNIESIRKAIAAREKELKDLRDRCR